MLTIIKEDHVNGTQKWVAVLLAATFVVSFLIGSVHAQCFEEELFSTWCGYQCNKISGYWICWTPDPDRCCWELVQCCACGEGAFNQCPECSGPGQCGF